MPERPPAAGRRAGAPPRALLVVVAWALLAAALQLYAWRAMLSPADLLAALVAACRTPATGPLLFVAVAALSPLLLAPAALLAYTARVAPHQTNETRPTAMIDKALRAPKETLLTPLARGPLRHLHPTAVTIVAAVVGLAAAAAAWQGAYLPALGLWALNRTLDGLDGTLARVTGRQSDLGAYLDILLDHLVYVAVPLGLALAAGTPAALLALALLLASFYLNAASWMYLAALLEKRSAGAAARGELTTVTMPAGLVEGAETVVLFTLFLLLPGALVPLFWLMAALVLVTVGQRLAWAARHL